ELAGVADVRYRGGVRRAAGAADLLREALADGVVVGLRRLELPAQQVVLFDDDGALVAVHRDRLGVAGPDAGGRLDEAEGAALEAQGGDRGVLDLDALVRQEGGEAHD